MDSRSIATVAGTALVTATLALIPFRASFVNATADEGLVFPLGQPTVVFDGVEVSLTCVDARGCIEGNPKFKLLAVNTTDAAASIKLALRMDTIRRPPRMARVGSRPATTWEDQRTLSLGPHETRELNLTAPKVPDMNEATLFLGWETASGKTLPEVSMLSFVTSDPAVQSGQ